MSGLANLSAWTLLGLAGRVADRNVMLHAAAGRDRRPYAIPLFGFACCCRDSAIAQELVAEPGGERQGVQYGVRGLG